jgi:hypothetical protein
MRGEVRLRVVGKRDWGDVGAFGGAFSFFIETEDSSLGDPNPPPS